MHTKYFQGSLIWCTQPPQNASWAWRGILRIRHLAVDLLKYHLGDGRSTSFFLDPWLGHPPILLRAGDRLCRDMVCDSLCKVGDFIEDQQWNLPTPTTLDMHELWPDILATPLGPGSDHISWTPSKASFSLHFAWEAIQAQNSEVSWASFVWYRGAVPRQAFCTWRALQRGLPSHDNLQCRGISLVSRCPLCCNETESIDHLLWSCEYSSRVWNSLLPQLCLLAQLETSLLGVADLIVLQFQQQHTSIQIQHNTSCLFCAVTIGL